MNNYQDVLERLEQATGNEVFCDVMCRFPYELNEEQLTEVCERCPLNNTLDQIVEDIKGMNKYYLDTEIVLEIIDKHKAESENKGMYIACKKCKYNHNGECDFYYMGSGNEIDMPCYREKELIKKATDNFLQAFVGAEREEENC